MELLGRELKSLPLTVQVLHLETILHISSFSACQDERFSDNWSLKARCAYVLTQRWNFLSANQSLRFKSNPAPSFQLHKRIKLTFHYFYHHIVFHLFFLASINEHWWLYFCGYDFFFSPLLTILWLFSISRWHKTKSEWIWLHRNILLFFLTENEVLVDRWRSIL